MDEEDKHLKFWRALHGVLENCRETLPYASKPERIHWSHPDDDWKNDAEVQAIEESCFSETDALIRYFCLKQEWPKRSKNNERYFADQRIRWALGFIRIFTIPLTEGAGAAIPRPLQSGWELLQWLLIEAYQQRFPPPPRAPFFISG
ncbi:MAG: hypothetical protein BGO12_05120 [Verrucomicrobia bacterium 61-8]|nr:hypothetical protein [Verrucomicrobiota bacterium]OJV19422.1 MAG: hypothetical protein BGO12_05120 [Verrucomicrobia bacterium 61-8]